MRSLAESVSVLAALSQYVTFLTPRLALCSRTFDGSDSREELIYDGGGKERGLLADTVCCRVKRFEECSEAIAGRQVVGRRSSVDKGRKWFSMQVFHDEVRGVYEGGCTVSQRWRIDVIPSSIAISISFITRLSSCAVVLRVASKWKSCASRGEIEYLLHSFRQLFPRWFRRRLRIWWSPWVRGAWLWTVRY